MSSVKQFLGRNRNSDSDVYVYVRYSNLNWKDYVISNMFSVPFLLFLIEKGVASFNIKIKNMCIKAIWNNDIKFIYEISKYDQRVSEFIFDYCLNYKNNLTNVPTG